MARVTTVTTADAIHELARGWRTSHQTVALVPTMGNLHEGHLSLARLARRAADRVVMSLFVNPTQFGVGEDFAGYPRTLDEDLAKLDGAGTVEALFVPDEREIYPFGPDEAIKLVMPPLARELCGASRPGHFDGVASVVCRLLHTVQPDCLVLGRKDYQQLILVRRMIADLRMPVRVMSGRTWREADGVAMSSRNRYLTREDRPKAPALRAALWQVRQSLHEGDRDYAKLEQAAVGALRDAGFRPDYVQVRRAEDLGTPAADDDATDLIVLGAAWLGAARLIDNTSA